MNVDLYRSLFVHRHDVFAEQHADRSYTPVRRALTDGDLLDHLAGVRSFGAYVIQPMDNEQYGNGVVSGNDGHVDPPQSVKLIVFDLDTYDSDALEFLCGEVEQLIPPTADTRRRPCLLLEDSGGHGYHVWLLLNEPIEAKQARQWAEPVRAAYEERREGSWPALEIFPKQDAVPEGGFGNLVKLPLGRHAQSGAWSIVKPWSGWARSIEEVQPFPADMVPEYVERQRTTSDSEDEATGHTAFACVNELLESGAPDGCRDRAMYFLARFWRSGGLNVEQVEAVCLDANDAFDPPLSHGQVVKCVRSAFRAEWARPRCGEDWHGSFCPGSDRMRSCPNFTGTPSAGSPSEDDEWGDSLDDLARKLRGK